MNWQSLQRSRALQLILRPLAMLYGVIVVARARAYAKGQLQPRRLRGAVVSVGNLTVGGVGKTPMVLWLAEKLVARGKRVAVLSRGYGGSGGGSDEVDLLRDRLGEQVLVAVGADRFAAGSAVEHREAIDIFLLDDGFQHMQLARDVDILLLDASRSLANERLLPAGLLREPISAMSRATVLVFTRTETQPELLSALSHFSEYPVFAATTKLLGFRALHASKNTPYLSASEIGAGPFFAFCGLGNPQQFFRDLENWQLKISATKAFPDHHRYDHNDAAALERAAAASGAGALLTTEKDANNLRGVTLRPFPVYVAVIEMQVAQESDFLALIESKLAQRAGKPA
jgi:tetraacyldisaccharide 4'-kinase